MALPPWSAMPGPRGWPVLGSFVSYAQDPLGFCARQAAEHGDVVRYQLGPGWSVTQIQHPDAIEALFVGLRNAVVKDPVTQRLKRTVGEGLLTSEGDTWLRNRRLVAPLFGPRQVEAYGATMVDAALRWADTLPPESERDVHPDLAGLTLDIVVRTLFDASMHGRVGHVGERVDAVMRDLREDLVLPRWVPTPGRWRLDRAVRELHALFDPVIARRRETAGGEDLLGRLLSARDEDGTGFSDRQIRDELLTVFMAGHETTALALTYALHLLALHPEAQEKVRDEVDGLDGEPRALDLGALRWTGAVVNEAMRLYPPAWVVGRLLVEDADLAGYRIPAGTEVSALQWIVHRDPRWWREPEVFRPERWTNGETESLPRFAFFPFGGGPRVCVGVHFARMEAVLVLAALARRIGVAPVAGFQLELEPSVTLRPRAGVALRVRRR